MVPASLRAGWLAVLAVLAATEAAGAGVTRCRVDGAVVDATGRPVPNVRVSLRQRDGTGQLDVQSAATGVWTARNLAPGDWDLTFAGPGFLEQTMVRTVYPEAKRNRIHTVLRASPFEPGLADSAIAPALEQRARAQLAETAKPLQIPNGDPREIADALFAQRAYAEAAPRYEALLLQEPDQRELLQLAGDSRLEAGDYDAALAHFQALAKLEPDAIATLSDLAQVYLKKQDVDTALRYLEQLLAKSPNHPTANFNVAEILLSADEPEEAIVHYEAALAARPDWPEACLRLGYASLTLGRYDKARGAFEKYLTLHPDGAEAAFVRETLQLLK